MRFRGAMGVGLILFELFLFGCSATPQSTETAFPTPPVAPSASPTSTFTPVVTLSPTAFPSPTFTPTPRPTRTPRPTQTPTPTPLPTLEPDEMQSFVIEMLASNGGCELPCWWGITLGETGWEEMRVIFREREINVWDGHLGLAYFEPEGKYLVNMLNVEFQEGDGLVQAVRISEEYYYAPFQDNFTRVWQRYALDQILSRHGVPSEVYLELAVGAGCIGSGIVPTYDMWVIYDHLGIAIQYSGILIRNLGDWFLCPVFGQRKKIEIRLQSLTLNTPIVSVESDDGGPYIYDRLTALTDVSAQEFYEQFRQPNHQSCMLVADPSPNQYSEIVHPPGSSIPFAESEDHFLVNMLASNGGCELPCWWGITPGTTTWEDAQQLFLSLGRSVSSWETLDLGMGHRVSPFARHAQYPFDYVLEHELYEWDGVVQLIGVIGHTLGGSNRYVVGWSPPQYFAQDWQRYTLDQILGQLGLPSEVLLHYWPHEGALYSVGVIYEDLGVMVTYMGGVKGEKEEGGYRLSQVVICPTRDEITDINIWLRAPDVELSMVEIFMDWRLGSGYYTVPYHGELSPSLGEATGMDLETFYDIYLNPNTETCLEPLVEFGDGFP